MHRDGMLHALREIAAAHAPRLDVVFDMVRGARWENVTKWKDANRTEGGADDADDYLATKGSYSYEALSGGTTFLELLAEVRLARRDGVTERGRYAIALSGSGAEIRPRPSCQASRQPPPRRLPPLRHANFMYDREAWL